jgi:DNA polymerase V
MQPEVRTAVLRAFPAGEVWGIGLATARKLAGLGVMTAAGLRDLDPRLARGLGTVVLERLVREMNGVSCLELEVLAPPRKGLAVTRSFGVPLTGLAPVREAVAAHATRAGEKLRSQGLVAGHLAAFVHTSPHRGGPRRHVARATRLSPPTADTRELVAAATRCVEAAWRDGFAYVKAGVLLDDLLAPGAAAPDLLAAPRPGSAALMAAVDALNARYGRGTVLPAAAGVERAWAQRVAHRSARYTTRLGELPVARA